MTTELYIPKTEIEAFSSTKGVCAVILNANHEILVGREMKQKESHERVSGQLSIPMETFKNFERGNRNAMLLAALHEVTTLDNIAKLQHGLHEAGVSGPIQLGEDVKGAVAVFHWVDEEEMPFQPSTPLEFTELQWMSPDDFMQQENIRPYAARTIQYAQGQGLLNGIESRPFDTLKTFDPERYNRARELYPDVG